jgi:hypothetical protein
LSVAPSQSGFMEMLSKAGGVELIRRGWARAAALTAAGKPSFWASGEACPHHFTLTEECLRTFDSNVPARRITLWFGWVCDEAWPADSRSAGSR